MIRNTIPRASSPLGGLTNAETPITISNINAARELIPTINIHQAAIFVLMGKVGLSILVYFTAGQETSQSVDQKRPDIRPG